MTSQPEKARASGGDRGALLLLLGVAALFAATLWMSREAWLPGLVETDRKLAEPAEKFQPAPVGALAEKFQDQQQQETSRLVELKAEAERLAQSRREAEEAVQEAMAARAEAERQRQDTARQLELEQARLEQEREETRKRLAAQAAARAQMEQARRAVELKLERERAVRADMERKAAMEQQRLIEAQQRAEQAAAERAKAEAALQAAAVEASDSATQDVTSDTAVDATVTATEVRAVEDAPASNGFSSNPCEGPSARFLSTCR